MTDITSAPPGIAPGWSRSAAAARQLQRRHRADRRLRIYGICAIGIALSLLVILLTSIFVASWTAWTQTQVRIDVTLDPEEIDAADPFRARYQNAVRDAIYGLFPEVESAADQRALRDLLSSGAQFQVRDLVVDDPSLIGETISVWVPVSDPIDQLHKGVIDRSLPPDRRRVSDQEIAYFDVLAEQDRIRSVFNTALFTSADSRFPELAGLKGALVGSFYLLLICFLLSVPIGVSAAVYLEEFAPKNRWTDLIEVNINNLAAVPSIVFGLLGLAVFLGFFGLPRSAPLVGGMVLSLMTLPTIIIATRAALKAVPPSIREAALGVGASGIQTVAHHVLPLAMPGILTGIIIGLAQALGETAPLLLIGMNAFITAAPESMMTPSTALPTQIFIWFDSPERGFVARTSAAIIVLLGFLIVMNAAAVILRRRFERIW
jgi:phosphate transport system permease protein